MAVNLRHLPGLLAGVVLLSGCGAATTRAGEARAAPAVVPGSPGEHLGYAYRPDAVPAPTPYPVACSRSDAQPTPGRRTVSLGSPPPTGSVRLSRNEVVVITIAERCTLSLAISDPSGGDPAAVAVVERHPVPPGVQGTAWISVRGVHAGTTEVSAFGGCAIPSPLPVEPAGIDLLCDDVGHAVRFTLQVDG